MLKKTTKYLLIGLVLGIMAIVTGYIVSARLSLKVETLISECRVQNQKLNPVDAPQWAKSPLVCEPQELESSSSSGKLVDIQASIVETHEASLAWQERSRFIGFLLFGILALPYCWQFLLQRIVELRQALVGR